MGEATPAAVLGAPLVVGGEVSGVLGLAYIEPGATFSIEDQRLVERFAQIASLAIERVGLHAELHRELEQRRDAEEELQHTVGRLTRSEHALRQSQEEMVRRLASAAEQRDGATGRHVERVSATCEQVARRLGLDDALCESLRLASPLHDIGKIAIRDDVLLKAGPLDEEERAEIERHAEIGHEMLCDSGYDLLDLAASIALTHHERFDGTGYPHGLHGVEIPLEGRIAAVADVFDALTSDRVYQPAFPIEQALAMMRDGSGTQFDPAVLDAFLDIHSELDVPTLPEPSIEPATGAPDSAPGGPAVDIRPGGGPRARRRRRRRPRSPVPLRRARSSTRRSNGSAAVPVPECSRASTHSTMTGCGASPRTATRRYATASLCSRA